ncbi:gamma-glutamyl-gamma-aminobutyrate hydrolase family protein [Ferrimonas balearica]|uniref:gamma-glutamyl-gamma-aminobutyrate hydrolase family protein n=1 Tax=Ferrimonas balearica TaxID=44012 RepID=UPI001C998013|nr:gamma-glutamyl-gamma-aminobutyrate hydrolase family protein [Ferrimonas balearica]MBY5991183.1 gamma-glutamyl-gamma-aminobutyrate hydrolase family protein [Ferrimonas balearica]
MPHSKPVIGLVSCRKALDGYSYQAVNEFYADAVRAFGGLPVLFAAGQDEADTAALLARVDGVLLPGSHSNVAPHQYGAEHHEPRLDEARDALSLTLIRLCAQHQIPILGICRGFQEMNVAMGGSLNPAVHEAPGALDHREPTTEDFAVKYAHAHTVTVAEGGRIRRWWPEVAQFEVNSLHNQGVATLAPPLRAEATAEDGLIEAFSLDHHPFFFGVQWHPEWQATELPFSRELFRRFIDAAGANRASPNQESRPC